MKKRPDALKSSREPRVTTLLTVADVADRLQVSEKSVRRWIAEGLLPVHRLGRQIRISEADLVAFIARSRCP